MISLLSHLLLAAVALVFCCGSWEAHAFLMIVPLSSHHVTTTRPSTRSTPTSSSSLYFFPRSERSSDDNDEASKETTDDSSSSTVKNADSNDDVLERRNGGFLPFFARQFNKEKKQEVTASSSSSSSSTAVLVETPPANTNSPAPSPPSPQSTTTSTIAVLSPEQEADRLRAEAERIRLEAERMDAELTLQKIAKLEQQIATSKNKLSQEDLDAMQNQIQVLQTKLLLSSNDGSATSSNTTSSTAASRSLSSASRSAPSLSELPATTFGPGGDRVPGGELATLLEQQRQLFKKDIDDTVRTLEMSPAFIKKLLAAVAKFDYDDVNKINLTDLALRVENLQLPPDKQVPAFTKRDIQLREQKLKDDPQAWEPIEPYIEGEDTTNITRMALLSLEYEYYFSDIPEDETWLLEALDKTAADTTIESLYPKCMRQGPEPTLEQVQQLVMDIRNVFPTTQQPQKVLGGYILRGKTRKATGDELIREIDDILAKKPAQQLSVFYAQDFSIFLDPDAFETFDPDEVPPILYVTGSNVVRPPRRVELTLTSAAGLATCWYLAIYPFLLNPAIAKRVEEQLALADAGLTPDLGWLSELSLPLFFVFVGIQLAGEVGHQVVAATNKVKLSVPTFVPSIITGITSTVTSFKTPPPNKRAMFDIALAGPLVGILASLLAIAVGSALTLTSDASLLPALPLEILRQSTLGGGVIENILGNGVLSIPEGAQGTAAVASITIPLHPMAVAGYVSLIVNALSLLPIGTTDGGRMALAVFGRGAKLLVGNIFLLTLLFAGFLGSDLFLFYFGFIILFQTGNEIAARNEFDKVEFSRVIMAIAAYVLMFLTLIPFQ